MSELVQKNKFSEVFVLRDDGSSFLRRQGQNFLIRCLGISLRDWKDVMPLGD